MNITWREAFRLGFAPQIATPILDRLREALLAGDPRLIQGIACVPSGRVYPERPAERACFLGLVALLRDPDREATAGQVAETFARLVFEADHRLAAHAPHGGRDFVEQVDRLPLNLVRAGLAEEIGHIVQERQEARLHFPAKEVLHEVTT